MKQLKKIKFSRGTGLKLKDKKRNGVIRKGDFVFIIQDYEVVSMVFKKQKMVSFVNDLRKKLLKIQNHQKNISIYLMKKI